MAIMARHCPTIFYNGWIEIRNVCKGQCPTRSATITASIKFGRKRLTKLCPSSGDFTLYNNNRRPSMWTGPETDWQWITSTSQTAISTMKKPFEHAKSARPPTSLRYQPASSRRLPISTANIYSVCLIYDRCAHPAKPRNQKTTKTTIKVLKRPAVVMIQSAKQSGPSLMTLQ